MSAERFYRGQPLTWEMDGQSHEGEVVVTWRGGLRALVASNRGNDYLTVRAEQLNRSAVSCTIHIELEDAENLAVEVLDGTASGPVTVQALQLAAAYLRVRHQGEA